MSKRALRRAATERIQARAVRIGKLQLSRFDSLETQADIIESTRRRADHLKACNSAMCANPRRTFTGKRSAEHTLQERRADQPGDDIALVE